MHLQHLGRHRPPRPLAACGRCQGAPWGWVPGGLCTAVAGGEGMSGGLWGPFAALGDWGGRWCRSAGARLVSGRLLTVQLVLPPVRGCPRADSAPLRGGSDE